MNLRLLVCALFAAGSAQLYAHPGHSLAEHGVGHLLASPYHVLTLVVVGLTLLAIGKMVKHRVASGFFVVIGAASIGAAFLCCFFPV
jgi:hypothetical protein